MSAQRVGDHVSSEGIRQVLVLFKQLADDLAAAGTFQNDVIHILLVEVEHPVQLFGITLLTIFQRHRLFVLAFEDEPHAALFRFFLRTDILDSDHPVHVGGIVFEEESRVPITAELLVETFILETMTAHLQMHAITPKRARSSCLAKSQQEVFRGKQLAVGFGKIDPPVDVFLALGGAVEIDHLYQLPECTSGRPLRRNTSDGLGRNCRSALARA